MYRYIGKFSFFGVAKNSYNSHAEVSRFSILMACWLVGGPTPCEYTWVTLSPLFKIKYIWMLNQK